jgi:hypothetical protein
MPVPNTRARTLYLYTQSHAPSLSTLHARSHPTRAHSFTRARKLIACCLSPHARQNPLSTQSYPAHSGASTPHGAPSSTRARKLIACPYAPIACLPPHARQNLLSTQSYPAHSGASTPHARAQLYTRAQAYSLPVRTHSLSPPTRAPEPSIYAILSCPPTRLRCEYTYDMSSFARPPNFCWLQLQPGLDPSRLYSCPPPILLHPLPQTRHRPCSRLGRRHATS